LKYKSLIWIALIGVFLVLPLFINNASAQAQSNYYVTVKPVITDALTYTSVGRNVTLSFQALWSYGSNGDQNIQNATAIIQVSNRNDKVLETLSVNTTSGIFSFNYSSASADILAFTPTKLVTQDGQEWNSSLVDLANNVYGFTYHWAQVWWDTPHVSLVSRDTSSLGNVAISVNITYLLLPEEGLQIGLVHVPKIVHDANVTINGVKAEETQTPGIYLANSSTWLPTAYVNVGVSQEGWTTTHTAFSFAHNANESIWTYAVAFGSVFGFAVLILRFFVSRKANNSSLLKHPNFPFYGAVLLAATSLASLYWGVVGLEGTLHMFDWLSLAALGIFSFALGIVGSIMALRKKNQALVIFLIIIPMFMNVVGVKSSLDMYQLANPWLIMIISLFLSMISGYFVSNSDELFQNKEQGKI
jgi:hypothetical protein